MKSSSCCRTLILNLMLAVSTLVAGCGGQWRGVPVSSGSDDDPAVHNVIMFGDSLSDVGTYAQATAGQGGKFTINPDPIWIERIASSAGTSITPNIVGYGADTRNWLICPQSACFGYAEGGSRVSAPNGIGNEDGARSGALTFPVTTQIASHLAANGDRFQENDLVFVFAGSNDVLYQQGVYQATVSANPLRGDTSARAAARAAMSTAAGQLVDLVRTQVLAKGARRVVMFTLPSISLSPLGQQLNTADGRVLLDELTDTFNAGLRQGIANASLEVLLYDANSWFRQVYQAPAAYNLVNIADPACDALKIASITANAVTNGSSLFCNRSTLVAGAARDERYAFADFIHPTPQVHKSFADALAVVLRDRGWMPR